MCAKPGTKYSVSIIICFVCKKEAHHEVNFFFHCETGHIITHDSIPTAKMKLPNFRYRSSTTSTIEFTNLSHERRDAFSSVTFYEILPSVCVCVCVRVRARVHIEYIHFISIILSLYIYIIFITEKFLIYLNFSYRHKHFCFYF